MKDFGRGNGMANREFRRFELIGEKSSKFWEIAVEGASVTVRFGRIGTAGQTKTKDHATEADARREAEKLILEKTKKGYVAAGAPVVDAEESAEASPSEAVTATLKALDDIKEWFVEEGATAIVHDLAGPLSEAKLKAAEAELGLPIPAEMRAVYRRHNGQRHWDSKANLFFRHGIGGFVGLDAAIRNEWRAFIGPWWDPEFDESQLVAKQRELWAKPLERNPEQMLPREWVRDEGGELLPEECSTAWLVFAWQHVFFAVVHLRTGRVFQFEKDTGLSLLADSFGAFLAKYADDLWNGKHRLVEEDDDSWVWV